MHCAMLVAVAALAMVILASAQENPSGDELNFEVVSVRPGPGDDGRTGRGMVGLQGNRWVAENVPLLMLIRTAYAKQFPMPEQIIGGPAKLLNERFTVRAVAESPPTEGEALLMLQRLLRERFSLVVHTETRDLPVYALVLARADGRLGPELRPVDVDCDALRAAWDRGDVPRPILRPPEPAPPCVLSPDGARSTFFQVTMTMGQFASALARVAGRPVFDRTGLNGFFYVNLLRFQDPRVPSAFNDIPPLFTALQTDLGLRLDPREEPFEVLVIDSVERPTPD